MTCSQRISGHKDRDQWICAILTRHDVMTPLELRVAVRLGIFFNCTTGQCDPGYARLARELGIPQRSARRCVAALVAYGFVGRDEGSGGSHDQKQKFSLFMPPPRGTDSVSPVRRTASVSPVKTGKPASRGGPKHGVTGVQNRGGRGTIRRPTKEPDEPDSAALHAARTSVADRESDNSTKPSRPDDQRAADAALIDTVAAQKQLPPSLASKNIGAAGNGADGAYAALWRAYPNQTYEGDAPKVFHQLLDEGVDPDVLIAGAAAYAKRCEGIDPEKIKLLCYWLRMKGWEDENRRLPSDGRGQARRSIRQ
jgi:hypothetical protein